MPLAALEHPFAPWLDNGFYVLHPGGDMESGLPGWTLSGGAAVVDGDDGLGVRAGTKVLRLPAGATVVTSPICIDETSRTRACWRAARGWSGANLNVDVLYTDTKGKSVVKGSKSLSIGTLLWAPTGASTSTPSSTGRRRSVPLHRAEGLRLAARRLLRRPALPRLGPGGLQRVGAVGEGDHDAVGAVGQRARPASSSSSASV